MTEMQRIENLYKSLTLNGELIHTSLILRRTAQRFPNNIALICDNETITYGALYARAVAFTHILKKIGVMPQDRVILFYENSIDFFVAYFGIWQAGAVVTPLNVYLQDTEVERIIHDSTPKAIVVSEHLKVKLAHVPQDSLPHILSKKEIDETLNSKTLELDIPKQSIDNMVALLYTSGTTGFPKGVMLSSRNIITNAIQAIGRLDAQPTQRVYCALPLFHSLPQNCCVWSNTLLGSTAIIVPKIDRRSLLLGLEHNPDVIIGVPALYGIFCLMKTVPFKDVKLFVSGGDALSDKIRAMFGLIYRRKICNGYGLTETSPFIAVDFDDYSQATNTIGKPFIGIHCSIRDENNREVPKGQVGTLWVKGDNIMLGYYNAPQATQDILKDGWLCTGDLAKFDANGKLVLAGRQKDIIIQKGVKIYPQEVENVLLLHKDVTQAAVVGIAENDGEIPIAFVASKVADEELLIKQLKELCINNLAFYKVPRQIIVMRELPITATGKVDKKKLKK